MIRLSTRWATVAALAVTLALAPSACAPLGSPSSQTPPSHASTDAKADRFAALDAALQSYVDSGQRAGIVMEVRQNGAPIYQKAVGWRDREAQDPIRQDTLFRIASQTKAIVTVAALILMEEGKLSPSDPVGKFLPEWAATKVAVEKPGGGYDVVPAKRPITIHDLMTHSAGVGYGWDGPAADAWEKAGIQHWYFANRDETVEDVVRRMAALPMPAQPGEKFVYGYGTDILGVVVEKASGQRLDAFLRERILAPLRMNDTFFYVPKAKEERLAVVYSYDKGVLSRSPEASGGRGDGHYGQGHYVGGPRKAFSGGAGLVSTAGDYSRFLQMALNGGELDGVRILKPETVAMMTRNQLPNGVKTWDGLGFGYAFDIREDGTFGWGGAYHSNYFVDPKNKLTVVYLTQAIPAGEIEDHKEMRRLVTEAVK